MEFEIFEFDFLTIAKDPIFNWDTIEYIDDKEWEMLKDKYYSVDI
jgi:hypothetical protein